MHSGEEAYMNPQDSTPQSENASDQQTDTDATTPSGADEVALPYDTDTKPAFITWPPPGLEQIQGALLPAIGFLGLGAAILVLPLLLSIGSEQSFMSLGPFGPNWWILAITSGLGLVILGEAFHRLFRLLRTGNLAVGQGHGWLTVAHVAADSTRDTGFLIQGARAYSTMEPSERASLLLARLTGLGLYLTGSLWVLLGFVASVFLAARGILDSAALWYLTLVPAVLFSVCALYCRIRARLLVRSARRRVKEEVQEEVGSLIKEWIGQLDRLQYGGVLGRGPERRVVSIRVVLAAALVVGLFLLIPILTFTFMGPVVQTNLNILIPRYQGMQTKAAVAEVYREYCLEPEPSISPQDAGQALHNLNYVGRDSEPDPLICPPTRRYGQPWLFGRNRASGIPSTGRLLDKATSELTRREWEVLEREASNPAHEEFALLARATMLDYTGARLKTPIPDTLSLLDLAIPRFQGVSDGARAHVAKAAYELHRGDAARAETTVREVISMGFLLLDDEQTLIGNLIGIVCAGIGGDALETIYRRTGRTAEADKLASSHEEAIKTVERIGVRRDRFDVESSLEAMAKIVKDERAMRGLRWEFLGTFATMVPVVNLHRAVFGPGEDYETWLEEVRGSLVRWPSEDELFNLYQYGWLVSPSSLQERGILEILLSITFGEAKTPGSFASLIRAFGELR